MWGGGLVPPRCQQPAAVLVDDERGEVVVLATVFQAVPPVLLGPRHAPRIAAGSEGKKAVPDGREEPWRQHAVGNRAVIAARRAPQIGARPNEFIPLGKHDPGALGVEPQALP